nr:hypothetical protein [Tanacetum cinerariifolium]
ITLTTGCSTTVGGTAYMNVNVPERDTFSENPSGPQQRSTGDVGAFSQDLGGLKRRHLRDPQRLQVPTNMDVDVPDLQMSLGAQLQTEKVAFSLPESISQNVTSASVAQGFGYGIFQQEN